MSIERTVQGWRASSTKKNQLVSVHYIGYSKSEVRKLFAAHLKTFTP